MKFHLPFVFTLAASSQATPVAQSSGSDDLWDEICLHMRADTLRNWHESVDYSLWTLFGHSKVSQTLYYYNADVKNEDYTVCGKFPAGEKIDKIQFRNHGTDGFAIQYIYLTYPDGTQQWFTGKTKDGQYVFRVAVDGDLDLDVTVKEFSVFCPNGRNCNLWPAEFLINDRENSMQEIYSNM